MDTRAWSTSMSELSKSFKSEEDLTPEGKTSSTLPRNGNKSSPANQALSSLHRVFDKSDSISEQPDRESKNIEESSADDVKKASDVTESDEVTEKEQSDDDGSISSCGHGNSGSGSETEVHHKLPNGVSIESNEQIDAGNIGLTPRLLPENFDEVEKDSSMEIKNGNCGYQLNRDDERSSNDLIFHQV